MLLLLLELSYLKVLISRPRHIVLAVRNDEELDKRGCLALRDAFRKSDGSFYAFALLSVIGPAVISQGGALPK